MPDEMFFTEDEQSLRRGKRRAPRTVTCRPCLIWVRDAEDAKFQGVVMDVNPYGMLVRMFDILEQGTEIFVQLMRDEAFQEPLAPPTRGKVVRTSDAGNGFTDLGVQLEQRDIRRPESKPVKFAPKPRLRYRKPRMHTIDVTLGGPRRRRGPG